MVEPDRSGIVERLIDDDCPLTPPAPPTPPPGLEELLALPLAGVVTGAGEPVAALGPGAAGKIGWADLRLAAPAGTTRLVHADARVPYQVGRLHTRADLGPLALLYLTMPTGGLLQGDRVAVRVVAETGVRARVTTPAATKIYGMATSYASQGIQLTTQPGAWLEWRPEPTIPYRTARYQQVTRLVAAPGSVLLWSEVLLPGRLAYGERHAYDWITLDLDILDSDGRLVAAERQRYTPSARALDQPGRLRDWSALISAYVLAPAQELTELEAAICTATDSAADLLIGLSRLPGEMGLVLRGLATGSQAAMAVSDLVQTVSRRHLVADQPPEWVGPVAG